MSRRQEARGLFRRGLATLAKNRILGSLFYGLIIVGSTPLKDIILGRYAVWRHKFKLNYPEQAPGTDTRDGRGG